MDETYLLGIELEELLEAKLLLPLKLDCYWFCPYVKLDPLSNLLLTVGAFTCSCYLA